VLVSGSGFNQNEYKRFFADTFSHNDDRKYCLETKVLIASQTMNIVLQNSVTAKTIVVASLFVESDFTLKTASSGSSNWDT
jgi:hypothetical protein